MHVLVTGVSGLLGSNLAATACTAGYRVSGIFHRHAVDIPSVVCVGADLTDTAAAERLVEDLHPDWIVHCAALTDVDHCEDDPILAQLMNAEMPRAMARAAETVGAGVLYISTDSVFDGEAGGYDEDAATGPLNEYARSKLMGEEEVLSTGGRRVVLRTNLYGWNVLAGKCSLAEWALNCLQEGRRITGFADVVFAPLLVNHLICVILDLMLADAHGLYHAGTSDHCSKHEFIRWLAQVFGLDESLVDAGVLDDVALRANRPRSTWLRCARLKKILGRSLPTVMDGLRDFKALKETGYVDRLQATSGRNMNRIEIGERWIGLSEPVYFIADIAANHDGSLERALKLIKLAAEAGTDAAKFQHFRAPKIVSQQGFESMGSQFSHQAKWKKSVFEVYEDASVPWEWTAALKTACEEAGIEFLSAPYDFEAADMLDEYMEAYKIGSGDITWIDHLKHIAKKSKPVFLATGASDFDDVQRAVDAILPINPELVLMQCNTNYTASPENFCHLQLNVLKTYETMYPDIILGLSDHTAGPAAVLGAVALGARVIEKHFTDDTSRDGPDHPFSTDPAAWRQMVDLTRKLESALGDGSKRVQPNEQETVVIQRRCLRAARDLPAGTSLVDADIDVLRPAPRDAIFPYDLCQVISRTTRVALPKGECIRWTDLA